MRFEFHPGRSLALVVALGLAACSAEPEKSCTVDRNADTGDTTLSCPDGTTAVIASGKDGADGADGADGEGCTAKALENDRYELTCPGAAPIVVRAEGGCETAYGEFDLGSEMSRELVQGCRVILGEVYLPAQHASVLASVEQVVGSLTVVGSDAEDVVLSRLTRIGGDLDVGGRLNTFSAPALELVGDDVWVHGSVTRVSLPSLRSIGDELGINDAPELTSVELDVLASLGFLELDNAPKLVPCTLPLLIPHYGYEFADTASSDGAACDNCPDVANEDQWDSDRDGQGDACDPDIDGDTVPNEEDSDPTNARKCADADEDGCDDCSIAGRPEPANDGIDEDEDGQCELTVPVIPAGPEVNCSPLGDEHMIVCNNSSRNFNDARSSCQSMGGRLYEPRSAEHLASTLSGVHHDIWVGLTDSDEEGTFVFASDGTAPEYSLPFASGEPNDEYGEDCLVARSSGQLNDVPCSNYYYFVCEPAPVVLPE